MTPPISKDWWAAAAAIAGTVPVAMGQMPPAPPPAGRQQAGIVTTAAPQAPSGIQVAPLFVDNASNQRLVNNTPGPMHVLFSDQSALTLAPGTEVMIAQYRFQPDQNRGNLAINLLKGMLRVVGGKVSKTNPTQVRTATATIGIRGGISIVEYQDDGQTNAKFLFGEDLTFTLDQNNRRLGGSEGVGKAVLTDEEFRNAGWFTDGGDVGHEGGDATGSGDSGDSSGQSDPSLVSQIRAVLTKPGYQAFTQASGLLTRIQTTAFTPESLRTALRILNSNALADTRGAKQALLQAATAALSPIPSPSPQQQQQSPPPPPPPMIDTFNPSYMTQAAS
jgi:hypothetical protein